MPRLRGAPRSRALAEILAVLAARRQHNAFDRGGALSAHGALAGAFERGAPLSREPVVLGSAVVAHAGVAVVGGAPGVPARTRVVRARAHRAPSALRNVVMSLGPPNAESPGLLRGAGRGE